MKKQLPKVKKRSKDRAKELQMREKPRNPFEGWENIPFADSSDKEKVTDKTDSKIGEKIDTKTDQNAMLENVSKGWDLHKNVSSESVKITKKREKNAKNRKKSEPLSSEIASAEPTSKITSKIPKAPKYSKKQTIENFKGRGLSLVKEKPKAKKKIKKKFPVKAIIIGTAALIALSFLLVFVNAPVGVVEWVGSSLAVGGGGEFPVNLDGLSSRDITYSRGQMFVITETHLKSYNRSGGLIFSRMHGFADPVLRTSRGRSLIYGIGATGYAIHTPRELLRSGNSDNNKPIVAADISNSGVYAIATVGDDQTGLVTVYNRNGREIFRYNLAGSYVTGVTVSENGRKVAVAAITTYRAEFVSQITVLRLDSVEPIIETQLPGEIVLRIEYADNNNISIITDRSFINFNDSGIDVRQDFENYVLNRFEISDEYVLLYKTAGERAQRGRIVVYSLSGRERANFVTDLNVRDISAANRRISVLSEDVHIFNFDGEVQDAIEIRSGATRVQTARNRTHILYLSEVERVN